MCEEVFDLNCFDVFSMVKIYGRSIDLVPLYHYHHVMPGESWTSSRSLIDRYLSVASKAIGYVVKIGSDPSKALDSILHLYQINPVFLRIEAYHEDPNWWRQVLENLPPSVEYLDLTNSLVGAKSYEYIPDTVHSIKTTTFGQGLERRTGRIELQETNEEELRLECSSLVIHYIIEPLTISCPNLETLFLGNEFKGTVNCPKLKHYANPVKIEGSLPIADTSQLETFMCEEWDQPIPLPSLKSLYCSEGIDNISSLFPSLERYETEDKTKCFGLGTSLKLAEI